MTNSVVAAGVTLCAALLASWPAMSAPATSVPKRGDRISVTACPFAGVTATCLMIRAADGTLYNITAATPKPRVGGRMIRLRGTVTDKASICGQGVVVERIRWIRTRQNCAN